MGKPGKKQAADQREDTARTLTVHVPLTIRKRGSRKVVIRPGNAPVLARPEAQIDKAVVKALARAHRWKRMLESGNFGSISELAAAEKTNHSYLCRVLRLSLLAPAIVERLLDGGGLPPEVQDLSRPFPLDWQRQVTSMLGSR